MSLASEYRIGLQEHLQLGTPWTPHSGTSQVVQPEPLNISLALAQCDNQAVVQIRWIILGSFGY